MNLRCTSSFSRSYSWSANVCGRKEWILYPPGEEQFLRDKYGTLPMDVTGRDLEDRERYPNADRAEKPLVVIQGPGETIYVPRYGHVDVDY